MKTFASKPDFGIYACLIVLLATLGSRPAEARQPTNFSSLHVVLKKHP